LGAIKKDSDEKEGFTPTKIKIDGKVIDIRHQIKAVSSL
jgi:hypothetical protein